MPMRLGPNSSEWKYMHMYIIYSFNQTNMEHVACTHKQDTQNRLLQVSIIIIGTRVDEPTR